MKDLELALERVPEEPGQVIPRGMLLRGKAELIGPVASGSFGIYDADRSTLALIGSPRPVSRLPKPAPQVVVAVSESFETHAWPTFRWKTLDVFMLENRRSPQRAPGVFRLPPTFPIDEAPEGLRFALRIGLSLGPVLATREQDQVVAAACCFWRSERYFDISIDTLPDHRRRGLGRAVATALVDELWPARAVHCNSAGEMLARDFILSLGFRRVGQIKRGLSIDAS